MKIRRHFIIATFLLALDQSTNISGYSVWKGKELIAHGHKSFSGKDYIERIVKLRDWVDSLIDALDGDLEIAIEDIQLQDLPGSRGSGLQTYKKLAHTQGLLLGLFSTRNIPYYIIPSASWKHTCGVKGKARDEQKRNAQRFVKTNFSVDPTQDEADAICIGYHVLQSGISEVGAFNWA